jgi:hypothetical protein
VQSKNIQELNLRKTNEIVSIEYDSAIVDQKNWVYDISINMSWYGIYVVQCGVKLPGNFPVGSHVKLWFAGLNASIGQYTITDGAWNPYDLHRYLECQIIDEYISIYRWAETPQLNYVSLFVQGTHTLTSIIL